MTSQLQSMSLSLLRSYAFGLHNLFCLGEPSLPYYATFPPGTIDHQQICSHLHKITTKNRQKLSEPIGTVKFNYHDKSDRLWYFNDWDVASDLFEQAWINRELVKNDMEAERLQTLSKFWEKLILPKQ